MNLLKLLPLSAERDAECGAAISSSGQNLPPAVPGEDGTLQVHSLIYCML